MMTDDTMPEIPLGETLQDKIVHRLVRLYEILQANKSQAQSDRQTLQQFISDIAHQTKTPISNLLMINTTLLERDVDEQQRREFLISEQSQLTKLQFLFDMLVKTSRLESGMLEMQMKLQPVSDTIAQALGGVVFEAEAKDIGITVSCDAAIQVPHDRKWTTEAIFNILQNAVKYTDKGGTITIQVSTWEVYTKIDITDTGRGIAKDRLNDIFKRFYRCPEVRDLPGIGVGLYLSREIISLQGGYIVAASKPGAGSLFSIYLSTR